MTFEEYVRGGRGQYQALVEAVRAILAAGAKQHGLVPHSITGRAKAIDSLAKKLDGRGIARDAAIDVALKDLAGVRIVFLTDSQVDAFGQAGVLRDNFDILNVNVHHPVPGTETEDRLFDSTNYMVALKPERLALPEYAEFEGLRCEIQVQTLLNHAWAEMDHDAFYKQPDVGRIGTRRLGEIKARMDDVMLKHLLPAGHDFDKIAGDMRRLLEADERFEATFEVLRSSDSNEELADALSRLDELILPQVDDPRAFFLEHLPTLVDVVTRTRGTPKAQLEAGSFRYGGRSGDDLALQVSKLIQRLKFADPQRTLGLLFEIFPAARSDAERKAWIDLATQFAANDLQVWEQYGPVVPRLILDQVNALRGEEVAARRPLVVAMLGKILSSDVGGMTATSGTVTLHRGTVPATDEVAAFRETAIGVLERTLDAAPDDAARANVLEGLRKAGDHPFNGGSDALSILVRANAARVMAIEAARVATWGLELRRRCEVNALHVHHRFGVLPPHLAEDRAAVRARDDLAAAITQLREALAVDPEFGLYRLLVGNDSVRPEAWDGRVFDYKATALWRERAFAGIVDGMSAEDAPEWVTRVRAFVREAGASGGLWPMSDWAKMVGARKPGVAEVFLDAMDDDLVTILRHLLLGVDEAGERVAAQRHVARWQETGSFLGPIGDYLRFQTPFDVGMLEALMAKAIEVGSEVGVLAGMAAAVIRHDEVPDERLVDAVFMPGVDHMTRIERHGWVQGIWGGGKGTLVASLDEGRSRRLLWSFVGVPEIAFEEDMLLANVAIRHPGLVLEFFGARVTRDRDEDVLRYSAIPHGLHDLQEVLAQHPAEIVSAIRQWYEVEPSLHQFRGAQFFHSVYPGLPAEASRPLADLIAGGRREDVEFVLETLTDYEGSELVYPLCMDAVEALPEADELLDTVTRVLGQKGVLTGEFGFVEAEADHRDRLNRFGEDGRPKVRAFVTDLQRRIQQTMAWEQRSAERQVAARKRQWGEE